MSMRWFIVLMITAYGWGAWHHLDTRGPEPEILWGDGGDGLFNLWVLHHGARYMTADIGALPDASIFWPDGQHSFFWSDNLLAWVPLFEFFRRVSDSDLTAFQRTVHVASASHYAALCFFFFQILLLFRGDKRRLPSGGLIMVPLIAYAAHFSPAVLITSFLHVQNLAAAGVFVLMGCLIAYVRSPRPLWLAGTALAQAYLFFTAPYYAVAGALACLLWGLIEIQRNPRRLGIMLLRSSWCVVPATLAVGCIVFHYVQAGPLDHSVEEVRFFSITWPDLFVPAFGSLRQWIDTWFQIPVSSHPERIAWLGPGVLAGLLAGVGWMACRARRTDWRAMKTNRLLWFFGLSFLVLHIKLRELRPFLSVAGVLVIGFFLYILSRGIARHARDDVAHVMGYLGVAATVFYGIALGPHGYYLGESWNPSLWGFFAVWFPGFSSIRAVGRLAYPGHVVLMGFLFAFLLQHISWQVVAPRAWAMLGVGLCLLQIADGWTVQAPFAPVESRQWKPTSKERAFFSELNGALVVFPARPFHRNSAIMLYFSGFENLSIMNGYSGRCTPRWHTIMQDEERYGIASRQPVYRALESGVDYVAFRLDWLPDDVTLELPEAAVLFETPRWLVLQANDIHF